ncbi:MAG: TRAP transporter large permease subunit [Frankiales bacterium]|nr:TRAP transporter large permease subunit [Frankiales bacterium]
MDHATISLLVLASVIVLFVWNRLPVGAVAVLASLSLYVTGVLPVDQALAGFGDPVVVFIAALFVVSEGIDSAGVTTWAGQWLLSVVGDRPRVALLSVMAMASVMTALITLNGAAAALIPMVVVIAMRLGVLPGRMLMPMAFAGSAGGLLFLTASPVNVLVAGAADDAGTSGFSFFSFTVMGVPLVLATIALVSVLGPRLLPGRASLEQPPDLSGHAATLADHYELVDGFYRLRVRAGSPMVGTPHGSWDLAPYPGLRLIAVQRGLEPLDDGVALEPDDVLVVTGPGDQVSRLVVDAVLMVVMRPITSETGELLTRDLGVAELVVPPRSPLVGETMFPGMVRGGDLVVLGIRRRGRERGAERTVIDEGDSLLVHGSWATVEQLVEHRDVLVVNSPDLVRRQAGPLGAKAGAAIAVLLAMIVLLAADLVPPAVAGLGAAVAMVLLRVVSSGQAYRAVSWQTVVLIGGLIPLSTAIETSGAADLISEKLLAVVGDGHPLLVLVALFVLTATLGQFISNTATVLIVIPIAVSAAHESGVSPLPILMAVAVAGSASFLTPVATPANMMVFGPGGYRFGDYWRLGLPLLLAWLVLALLIVPRVWPL